VRLVKGLLVLAVVATLIWGGLWFVATRALDLALTDALDDPRAPVRAQGHVLRGFPNRVDITLTEPRFSLGALDWAGPFVQVFSLVYRPHHVVIVLPQAHRLETPGGARTVAAVTTQDTRASLVMRPAEKLALDRFVLVSRMPALQLEGERLSADALRLAVRPVNAGDAAAGPAPASYEAVIEIEAAFPDPAVMDRIDPDRLLPRRYDVLRLAGEVRFDAPLDLEAVRGRMPAVADLALTGARAAFDGIDLTLAGRAVPDARGRLSGEVTLTVSGWPALSARLAEAGLIAPEALAWVQAAAPGLARPGAPEVLDIPLRLEAGQLRLGPLVLAEVPAF